MKQKEKQKRSMSDHYVTPSGIAYFSVNTCIELKKRYCKGSNISAMTFLEPGCGTEAPFLKEALRNNMECYGLDIMWMNKFQGANSVPMYQSGNAHFYGEIDFVSEEQYPLVRDHKFDIIATNPPFIEDEKFVIRCLDLLSPTGVLAIIQKMSYQSSQGRFPFFQKYPPAEIHNLIKRPSFAHGKTDSQEYAIYFWLGSDLALKIRKKWGVRSIVKWQDNRGWAK